MIKEAQEDSPSPKYSELGKTFQEKLDYLSFWIHSHDSVSIEIKNKLIDEVQKDGPGKFFLTQLVSAPDQTFSKAK